MDAHSATSAQSPESAPIPQLPPQLSPVSSSSGSVYSDEEDDDGSVYSEDSESSFQIRRKLAFRAELEFLAQVPDDQEDDSETGHLLAAKLQVLLMKRLEAVSLPGWGFEVDHPDVDLRESIPAEHISSHETWKLTRIRSPLMALSDENLEKFSIVLDTVKSTRDLKVGLNHIPRLRVEVKPLDGDFALEELKDIARFLWSVSPLLDQLHARYCGPGSTFAPGLMFADAFSPLPFLHLSEATWRGETVETLFDHCLETPLTTQILKMPKETAFSQLGIFKVLAAESVQELVELLAVRTTSFKGKKAVLGAYNFSNILKTKKNERTLLFAQHAGTMEFQAIRNWIKVCHGLVLFCVNASERRQDHVLARIPGVLDVLTPANREYAVYDLLGDVNLQYESSYYHGLGPYPYVPDLARVRQLPLVNLDDTPDLSPYTFGIEFEFLAPYTKGSKPDPEPSDSRWVYNHVHDPEETGGRPDNKGTLRNSSYNGNAEHLAEVLNKLGYFSCTYKTLSDALDAVREDDVAALLNVARQAGFLVRPSPALDCHFQTWLIERDLSLSDFHAGLLGYAGVVGLELATPVMRYRKEDFERVVKVVKTVRSCMRPMLDESCGLHVHVGSVRRFSLRSLKRIVSMVWAADPVIFALVHPYRQDNEYSIPLRGGTTLGAKNHLEPYDPLQGDRMLAIELESHIPMDRIPKRLREEFSKIWTAPDLLTLKALVRTAVDNSRASVALNIKHPVDNEIFVDAGPANRVLQGTIEFRTREGSLDPELVVRWAKLVTAMVEKAETSSPWQFCQIMAVVLRRGASEAERLGPFLDALGLWESKDFWAGVAARNKVAEMPAPRPTFGRTEKESEDRKREWHEKNIVSVPLLEEDFGENAAWL
ncbi:hypothetical protein CPLU01_04178 [Colletotrichum plurivorum]|uniref:Amidoligase enzyme n=1 Tax=Colletotrichum plurivorum TaxID=2175906 RepID=A0A8H6KQY6_9PEZI|nr:hypothetical protein CPLU01_04178 [Colletotrichum plurivorum]